MAGFSIIPKHDAQQAVRIKLFFLTVVASLIVLAFLGVMYLGGYLALSGLKWCAAGMLVLFVVFYVAIRSGFNLKFRDPSLTVPQMISAFVVVNIAAYHLDSDARGTILPILLMIFYFGIYRLDTRAMTAMALVNVLLFGVTIALFYLHHSHLMDLNLELMRIGVLALVSLWFGMVGGHVTELRRELAVRKEAIDALLERDDLTGVGNRRFLTHMLEQEKSRADRTGSTFCVAMMDLDFFKKVNDTYGHQAGDRVLSTFAQVAQQGLRRIDYFGRYGGEEFLLIMSDTGMEGAQVKAERLRADLEHTRFNDIDPALVQTVSVGIVEYRRGEPIDQIELRADKAMYKAKSKGRNRIEFDKLETPIEADAPRSTRVA